MLCSEASLCLESFIIVLFIHVCLRLHAVWLFEGEGKSKDGGEGKLQTSRIYFFFCNQWCFSFFLPALNSWIFHFLSAEKNQTKEHSRWSGCNRRVKQKNEERKRTLYRRGGKGFKIYSGILLFLWTSRLRTLFLGYFMIPVEKFPNRAKQTTIRPIPMQNSCGLAIHSFANETNSFYSIFYLPLFLFTRFTFLPFAFYNIKNHN